MSGLVTNTCVYKVLERSLREQEGNGGESSCCFGWKLHCNALEKSAEQDEISGKFHHTMCNQRFGQKTTLANSEARINVMTYTLFYKLGLGEKKPTCMTLQLADYSVHHLRGIIEDV